ncbi:MAG: NmrA family NAD(P)-binding protein [Mycobacterium sp.]
MTTSELPSAATVLVTGATGTHGRTGQRVVDQLLAATLNVRVLVRRESAKSDELRALGAEIHVGDLHNRASLLGALDGVQGAYFTYPIAGGIVSAAGNFASAIRALDIAPRVVVMSMGPSSPDSPSHLGRAAALAEEIMGWSGINPTVLRVAGFFFENIGLLHAQTIKSHGVIRNNFGDGAAPWISGQDSADLGVAALLRPELFAERSIHYLPGAELLSHLEIAKALAAELDRSVEFESISREQWHAELVELAASGDGAVNTDMAAHISNLGSVLGSGKAPRLVPDAARLEALLGRPPMTFADYLHSQRDVFV